MRPLDGVVSIKVLGLSGLKLEDATLASLPPLQRLTRLDLGATPIPPRG